MTNHFYDDADVLARTLYGEARGEGLLGIEAVANVILNRVALAKEHLLWWGKTVAEVCLKPLQFSCWNPDDKNFQATVKASDTDPVFRLCQRVAVRAMNGFLADTTHGATHYHAKQVNPAWARALTPVYEYGNHLFYRQVG
nr:MAG TPA_asm: lytic transglycosylase [Caudoviricetes sp.]